MTSERKIEANRANGRASRGPKTAEGKRRSSRNACRHGLSLPVLADPVLSKEAEALARQIAASPAELQEARGVAEAQVDLVRIRRARHHLVSQIAATSTAASTDVPLREIPIETLDQLLKIDRYEQRAMSRRRFAIRRLDRIQRQETSGAHNGNRYIISIYE